MAIDKWTLFKQFWRTDDEDAPITDASTADDYLVEDSIIKFQTSAKEITDITVTLSSSRAAMDETLRKLKDSVTLAYSYLSDNRVKDAQDILEKALGM